MYNIHEPGDDDSPESVSERLRGWYQVLCERRRLHVDTSKLEADNATAVHQTRADKHSDVDVNLIGSCFTTRPSYTSVKPNNNDIDFMKVVNEPVDNWDCARVIDTRSPDSSSYLVDLYTKDIFGNEIDKEPARDVQDNDVHPHELSRERTITELLDCNQNRSAYSNESEILTTPLNLNDFSDVYRNNRPTIRVDEISKVDFVPAVCTHLPKNSIECSQSLNRDMGVGCTHREENCVSDISISQTPDVNLFNALLENVESRRFTKLSVDSGQEFRDSKRIYEDVSSSLSPLPSSVSVPVPVCSVENVNWNSTVDSSAQLISNANGGDHRMERRQKPVVLNSINSRCLNYPQEEVSTVTAPSSTRTGNKPQIFYDPYLLQHSSGSINRSSQHQTHHVLPVNPVKSKPQLPAYFSIKRRPALRKVCSDPHDSGAYSDGETKAGLENIESILGELNFSKYRRCASVLPNNQTSSSGTLPSTNHLTSGLQTTKFRYVNPQQRSSSGVKLASGKPSTSSTHGDKLRELRELTERLKPAIHLAKQEVDLQFCRAGNARSTTLPRRHEPVLRSASVPEVDGFVGHASYDYLDLGQADVLNVDQRGHWYNSNASIVPTTAKKLNENYNSIYSDVDHSTSNNISNQFEVNQPHQNLANLYGRFRTMASYGPKSSIGPWCAEKDILRHRAPSNLSLDSASDLVLDESLVADTNIGLRPVYHVPMTSASAPTTPGPYRRGAALSNEPNKTFDFQVEAALTELQKNEGKPNSSITSQYSLDRRKRRKGIGWFVSHPPKGSSSKEQGSNNNSGRSLTFPPHGSISDDLLYSGNDNNVMRSFWNSGDATCATAAGDAAVADRRRRQQIRHPEFISNDVLAADRHSNPADSGYDVGSRCLTKDDNEHVSAGKPPKKKHYSDPSTGSGDKNCLNLPEVIICARSEPQLPSDQVSVSAIPMTSPVSPGHHERSLSSEGPRNDDDDDRHQQPHQQQRRYYKKRLRGPYGELLEEEMRKSGEKHLQKLTIPEELLGKQIRSDAMLDRVPTPTSPPLEGSRCRHLRQGSESLDENRDYEDDDETDEVEDDDRHSFRMTNSPCLSVRSFRQEESEIGRPTSPTGLTNLSKNNEVKGEDVLSFLKRHQDTRTHVVAELYDTEKSYVESLQILVNKYFRPLKGPECLGLVDTSLVDDMFFQIPEILNHHETFLDVLKQRLENWDNKQKVGDVFVDSFAKQPIIDTYTSFINNWKTAKEAIKIASHSKPAFAKYLEHLSREHKGKLTLDALLIMPVQRIPRYELLIKELLKHTQLDHPDHGLLLIAQKEVHDLAVKINHMEREAHEAEQMQIKLKEMESVIDGLLDGSLGTKKERCLFLFSDLLVITSIKRKSGTIRKTSTMNSPASFASAQQDDWRLEANKYKLLMRIGLEELNIARSNDAHIKKALLDIQHLEEDTISLNRISEIAGGMHCPRQSLDDVVKEMVASIAKQLQDKQTSNSQLLCLELTVTTQVGLEMMTIIFSAPDKRGSWEATFHQAKEKLALLTDRRPPPEFLYPLPIRKTRAGLQFTCAASTLSLNAHNLRDVWVCNSDGYVGQVCVLSLQPEPTVTSCNGVCNARILCITSIPCALASSDGIDHQGLDARRRSTFANLKSSNVSCETFEAANDEETIHAQMSNNDIQLDSESSDEEREPNSEDDECSHKKNDMVTQSKEEIENRSGCSGEDGQHEAMLEEVDNLEPTMWLGTEDGCIHVYNCNDNIRIKRNKIKLQHPAAINCIIYLDGQVFVSLANGDLMIYSSDSKGGWNTNEPMKVTIGSAVAPVIRMLAVHGKLWCGCQCMMKVINTVNVDVEHSFAVHSDMSRPIQFMVTSGLGVWISIQNSSVVKLYHATTYEFLLDVNVSHAVTKMLAAGCDDIIRQHKAACLRVTALLACKDLLWVGTSTGVILNLALPHLTPTTTTKMTIVPNVSGIPHGHTGHVRFLTSVEATPSAVGDGLAMVGGRSRYSHRSIKYGKDGERQLRRYSATPANLWTSGAGTSQQLQFAGCNSGGMNSGGGGGVSSSTSGHRLLVISGGDGYEDFRLTADGGNCNSETAGRDDSTNHLLLWQV